MVLRGGVAEEEQAQNIADNLVEWARTCMYRVNKVSPFECKSRDQFMNDVLTHLA
jgi:hypothetical protein